MTCLVLVFDELVMLVIHKIVPEKKACSYSLVVQIGRQVIYSINKSKGLGWLGTYTSVSCIIVYIMYLSSVYYICRLCMFRVRNITMKCFTKEGRKR